MRVSRSMRVSRLALGLLVGSCAAAEAREVEVGAESFFYRTTTTPLNRDNVLGLDRNEQLLRGALSWKEIHGPLRVVFRGYVQRSFGGMGDGTSGAVRQAHLQYAWGSALSVRLGKQRIAWGSGFAWNPTNRLEPPKNPLNTGLEQEGSLAARVDWIPSPRAGVILVASRSETSVGDLPFETASPRRTSGAARARWLVKDTDLALVFTAGRNQRTLVGVDVGRDVGPVSAHVEGAVYRGSEIAPDPDDRTFCRIAAGLLRAWDTTSLSLEYFYNGEGYTDAALDAYLASLDALYARASDPRFPPALREQLLRGYLASAAVPFSGGLGLRRQYLQASWTRSEIRGKWTLAARGLFGLSDGGVALTPGIVYAPRGDVTVHLDGVLLLGPEESEYRLAPLRGAVQARIKFLF